MTVQGYTEPSYTAVAERKAQRRECAVDGCETLVTNWDGRCQRHYLEFCRRAGSFTWRGCDQGLADFLADLGFSAVGWWPLGDLPEMTL